MRAVPRNLGNSEMDQNASWQFYYSSCLPVGRKGHRASLIFIATPICFSTETAPAQADDRQQAPSNSIGSKKLHQLAISSRCSSAGLFGNTITARGVHRSALKTSCRYWAPVLLQTGLHTY